MTYACTSYAHRALFLQLMIIGALLSLGQFAFLDQTVNAGMGALTLVWNAWLAWLILGEKLTPATVVSSLLIMLGVVLSVAFRSIPPAREFTPEKYAALLVRPTANITSICVVVVLIACVAWLVFYDHTQPGISYERSISHNLIAFIRTFISGLAAGGTAICTKGVVESVAYTIDHAAFDTLAQWQLYLLLVGLVICLFFQMKLLNSALQRFDTLVVVPVYQLLIVTTGVVFGILYLDEGSALTPLAGWMLAFGTLIAFVGAAVMIVWAPQPLLDDAGETPSSPKETVPASTDETLHIELQISGSALPVRRNSSSSHILRKHSSSARARAESLPAEALAVALGAPVTPVLAGGWHSPRASSRATSPSFTLSPACTPQPSPEADAGRSCRANTTPI